MRAALVLVAIALTSAVAAPAVAQPRAGGGVAILSSSERAPAVVAGFVARPQKVDLHGWAAPLRVDGVVAGDVKLGDTVKIAWEELSPARKVRFEEGERVLVVLDALPTQSLWRKRFPDAGKEKVFVVASGGEAFLRQPSGATLDGLQHYLAMSASARDGDPGTLALAELVASAEPSVAREALDRLESQKADAGMDDAGDVLLRAAANSERDPTIRGRALALAAKHNVPSARDAALALSKPGSAVRAQAWRALAALPGGVSYDEIEKMLADPDPKLRVVGVEVLTDADKQKRVIEVARSDSAPEVRLAAGQALIKRQGVDAIPHVIGLLDDSDAKVRSSIAADVGALGTPAVKPLRTVVDEGSERAALAAVLGLARSGEEGGVALYLVAHSHKNEAVRKFAELALGKLAGPDKH